MEISIGFLSYVLLFFAMSFLGSLHGRYTALRHQRQTDTATFKQPLTLVSV